jgi:hypothetical protein
MWLKLKLETSYIFFFGGSRNKRLGDIVSDIYVGTMVVKNSITYLPI